MRDVPQDGTTEPHSYRLSAFAICHDLRCNLRVEVLIALPQIPTASEAVALLRQAAEERLILHSGEGGYQYELICVQVEAAEFF